MLDSTYLVGANPNSMRDQGQCRNAVYNMEGALLGATGSSDPFYTGREEFLSSSGKFHPEDERLGWVKSS
jgi:hypothetical protein